MVITPKIRAKLVKHLPADYRKIISERVKCHPNTVYNVLNNEHDNLEVATALIELAHQEKFKNKPKQDNATALVAQL